MATFVRRRVCVRELNEFLVDGDPDDFDARLSRPGG